MKIAAFFIGLALAVAPDAAFAATDIGCLERKLGTDVVARIGDRVIAASDKHEDMDAALDIDRDAVISARNACRTANSWSNAATDLAISYLKAQATRGAAERVLVTDGFSPPGVAERYAAMSPPARQAMIGVGGVPTSVIKSINRATDAIKPDAARRARLLVHVTIYYSALSATEFYPGEFAKL